MLNQKAEFLTGFRSSRVWVCAKS